MTDAEERWAQEAKMARWLFDQAMVFQLYGQNVVFPLGPEIDVWEPMGGNATWLSRWEDVPHRK